MKPSTLLNLFAASTLALLVACKKGEPAADASVPLQESFQTAAPEVQQAVQQVTTSLKAGNYQQATRTLAPVVDGRPLTDAQRHAVGVALQQINQAIATDPQLDTREMYELRAKMFRAVDSGPRF